MSARLEAAARILFVTTTSDFGGAELLLKEIVLRLDRTRFAPSVLSLTPLGRVGREIEAAGVPSRSLGLSEGAKLTELPGASRAIASMIREQRIQLVHAQLYRANVLSCLASRLVRPRPRVVFSQHSLYAMTGKKAEWMARRTAPLADRIVAVSPEVEAYVKVAMGARADRIAMIPNGVDGQRFRPGRDEALRLALGFTDAEFVVGCVGRLSPEKGVDRLLEAVAALAPTLPNLRVMVVGDGPMRAALEAQVAAASLERSVSFLGARRDVADLYRAMDLFALPSRREASPLALLEAMASERPIVATRVGGVEGVAGETAVVVSPDSSEALADAILRLATDSPGRERLAASARERFEAEFSIERTVSRHESLYAELLDPR